MKPEPCPRISLITFPYLYSPTTTIRQNLVGTDLSLNTTDYDEIRTAIRSGRLKIGVYGLGWMGIPTACLFLQAGATVIGVDADPHVIEQINSGKSPIEEPGINSILARCLGSTFSANSNLREAAALCDIMLIIVPTSIDIGKKPDYTAVEKVSHEIGMKLRPGSLIIVESTVGPGVTEGTIKILLEKSSGLTAGKDFLLAYSPIRAMSGQVLKDIAKYPRIVSGINDKSLKAASAVLSLIVNQNIISIPDIKTAETVKLFENTYRDVNIALANELACLCEGLGIDFAGVREAANTQPYCHLHIPGIGVGGHCIPVNPYFLVAAGAGEGVELRLVQEARRRNDRMPRHTVSLVESALRDCGRTLGRSSIAVLGISYRANIKEARYSPSVEVIRMLHKRGARVRVYDPYFTHDELKAMGYASAESFERTVDGANCLLITVAHDQFKSQKAKDLARLLRKPGCIVDAARILNPNEVRASNLVYYGVGYGHKLNPDQTALLPKELR